MTRRATGGFECIPNTAGTARATAEDIPDIPVLQKIRRLRMLATGGNDMDIGLVEAKSRFSEMPDTADIANMGKPVARRTHLCENSRNRKDIVNRLFDYQQIDGGTFGIKDAVNSGRK
jgi:hypothetical protein